MYTQQEESAILQGIDEIFFNLRHIPVDDVAHFLVKYDPNLAETLATAISFEFLDKDLKNVR